MAGGFDPAAFIRGEMLSPSPMGDSADAKRSSLPTTDVELTLRCVDLAKADLTSKSDPFCVVFLQSGDEWVEAGRTETLDNDQNPAWSKKVILEYRFEERQPVKFEVYDADSSSSHLKDHDLLGAQQTTLSALVSSPCKQWAAVLTGGKAKMFVNVEEVRGSNDVVQLQLTASDLDKKDTFGKSDPFYVISRSTPAGQFAVVHRGEVIKNNLNPVWKPVNLVQRELCGQDPERPLKVDVYDWDSDGGHDLIGSFKTNYKQLQVAMAEKTKFDVIHPKKEAKKKNYKNSGTVSVKYFQVIQRLSFVDYLQGGTQLNFSVAVDFTASNGDPTDYRSLHYRHPETGENQYTQAIRAVGGIIQDYDADKQFPALGFGAKVPPHFGIVSHEFFLNMEAATPYCDGVDGVLRAYDYAQQRVQQYGPTYFTPVIQHVAKFAAAYQDGRHYFVLLILTDGIITDLEETKKAIVEASTLPLSLIVVGIGNENFDSMDELDSDDGLLEAAGRVAARDIVQFVEIKKFVKSDGTYDQAQLARHVLAELPKQVVGWMTIKGLKPWKA